MPAVHRRFGCLEIELAFVELSEVHEQLEQVGAVVVDELLHRSDELSCLLNPYLTAR